MSPNDDDDTHRRPFSTLLNKPQPYVSAPTAESFGVVQLGPLISTSFVLVTGAFDDVAAGPAPGWPPC